MPVRKPKKTQPHSSQFQRALLAGFALLFLAMGMAVGMIPSLSGTSREFLGGMFLKLGVVLGLGWLAAPQLAKLGWQRLQGSLLVAVVVVLVLWAIRPRIGAIAGAALIVGSLLYGVVGWLRSATKP